MPIGYEGLVRFDGNDKRPVSSVFAEANRYGCSEVSELATAGKEMRSIAYIPNATDLSINVLSPHIIPVLIQQGFLNSLPLKHITLEVTEHFPIAII